MWQKNNLSELKGVQNSMTGWKLYARIDLSKPKI